MNVSLKLHATLDDALGLAPDVDVYAAQVCSDFRDESLPSGVGERLLRRALSTREGLIMTAHDEERRLRIGICITAPFEDPLVGDAMPMVVVLHTHPDYRHRGLAGRMVQAVGEELSARGFQSFAARAGHNDDALISMGERWGFVRQQEIMVKE